MKVEKVITNQSNLFIASVKTDINVCLKVTKLSG